MKDITPQEITNTLIELGIQKTDSVFIHSSLFTLGRVAKTQVENIPKTLLECFQNAVGESGNIFMPCFNYQYPKSRSEDLRQQKSVLGFWPEWFRNQPSVIRSGHPMFSICGIGPKAIEICRPSEPEYFAFGEGSTFERLVNEDAVLVLQGIGLRVATVVVQIEAMLGVKYRFNKPFFGQVTLANGQQITADFYHFCFPINNAYRENYQGLEQALLDSGVMQQASLGRSFIYTVRMKALFDFVANYLSHDKFALLNCRPQQLYKYENGKEITYCEDK
jgi:aminoglycoside 3-N-acetyltransferase